MRSIIYFQGSFWNNVSSDTTREGIRTMLNLSDVLINSSVVTDASEDMIGKDVFLRILIRKGNYQRCAGDYIARTLNNLNNSNIDNLSATYMLDMNSDKCVELENRYGIAVVCKELLPLRTFLFEGDGFTLDKNKRYESRYMTFKEKLNRPCNSLIVIDPYLLAKQEIDGETKSVTFPNIANNIESLLDAILPQKLDIDFHLSVISYLEIKEGQKMEEIVKRAYERLRKCLKRKRKELNVKLGFFYTDRSYNYKVESFHSRHIVSNNFMLDSEDGFDLFNDKGYITKNNPTVSIVYPRLFGNSRQDMTKYEKWIESVKKFILDSSDNRFCGTKENRLFDLIK